MAKMQKIEELKAHTVVMIVTNNPPHLKMPALILPGEELDEDETDQLFALTPGNEEPLELSAFTAYRLIDDFSTSGLLTADQFAAIQNGEIVEENNPPKCPF
ncbi:hypothetical protein [Vibrio phage vB_ValS_PJ32]|nr:hypothetical protein [Vibrio phage vB_ValS_PJ32]